MGGKHLKKLRAERAKVQLKKKKVLPKGQNVTDTSFKAKKIITIEQLKKVDENVPVSAWNLTLKDLINRLNHHNYMTRLNSLNGIKELTTNYPHILAGPSLRIIITRVLELLIDIEHKIRITAINFLDELFSQLPPHFLQPFHDLFNVHVCCAMTHRELSIQQDALKFVDVMIKHAPQAAKKNFTNLVQNFIRILTGHHYGHHSEVTFSKKSKSDLEKSKTEVLRQFHKLLGVRYSEPENNEGDNEREIEVTTKKARFDLRKIDNNYTRVPDLSSLFKVFKNGQNGMAVEDSDTQQSEISLIVPLLFDIWVEFAPNFKSDEFTSECLLTESIAEILKAILEIFLLLYEKTVELNNCKLENWFKSTYGTTFCKTFMKNFPYLPAISTSKAGQITDLEVGYENSKAYMMQNLILCHLYYRLRMKLKNDELIHKIEKYVLDTLRLKNIPDFKVLAKIIEGMIDSQKQANIEGLLTSVVKIHDSTSSPDHKRRLFTILTKVAFSEKHSAIKEMGCFKKWMTSLSERLFERHVPHYVVETILKVISCEAGANILKDIEARASQLISHLPNITVEGGDKLQGQKLVANILCRCGDSVLEEIVKHDVLTNESYPPPLRTYILDIISYKLKDRTNS